MAHLVFRTVIRTLGFLQWSDSPNWLALILRSMMEAKAGDEPEPHPALRRLQHHVGDNDNDSDSQLVFG